MINPRVLETHVAIDDATSAPMMESGAESFAAAALCASGSPIVNC